MREHRELRAVLQLTAVPDYTTLYRFLRRLDGTGLSLNATSSFFIRRIEQHSRGMTRWSHWLKYLIAGDLDDQIILAQRTRQAP